MSYLVENYFDDERLKGVETATVAVTSRLFR